MDIWAPSHVLDDREDQIATRGSHAKYRKDDRAVIVPLHRSLAPGTLRSILRQADWTVDDLTEHLK
ncbi:type II toxin-antitoxin system HicA family toxin [Streptomyces sp. NPDC101152]|uniref:type II toxin-antitoxin system HicA family toxin n=1 Tax=Streptomyces sp. NPDC101152 TaxID=3366116 RepID=UPI003804B12E